MPRTRDESTPKEQGQTSDTETEIEYEAWQRGDDTPKSPPPPPRKPRHAIPDDERTDRRVIKRNDILYFENMDHKWVASCPYYIRLGRKPATIHRAIDEHWTLQKKLWNVESRD